MKNNNYYGYFFVTLGLLFIIFKLTHVIDWNWFWVLLPVTWEFILLGVLIMILGAISWYEHSQNKKYK